MAPSTRRGLFRLALVLMIVWNLFVLWLSFKSINTNLTFEAETDCMKTRPSATLLECSAEDQSFDVYSQWAEFKKEVSLSDIALIECLPPVVTGALWCSLWCVAAAIGWVLRGFGIQIRKPDEVGGLRGVGQWFIAPKNMLAVSVALVALAVSYYFLVSLPALNRDRLQFERQSAAAGKAGGTGSGLH